MVLVGLLLGNQQSVVTAGAWTGESDCSTATVEGVILTADREPGGVASLTLAFTGAEGSLTNAGAIGRLAGLQLASTGAGVDERLAVPKLLAKPSQRGGCNLS